MPSKKAPSDSRKAAQPGRTPADKRAPLPLSSAKSKAFGGDWERLTHSGRYDMRALKKVMMPLIENNEPLPPERHDHELSGPWAGFRECHIGGDFLLIYQLSGSRADRWITFTRCGTHADLFE